MAVHILSYLHYSPSESCTSSNIATSVNTNPVVIRNIMAMLKKAGLVEIYAGVGGSSLLKNINEITLFDIYSAVNAVKVGQLFNIHDHPNPNCLIGANIQDVLKEVLNEAENAMLLVLANKTLGDIISSIDIKRA